MSDGPLINHGGWLVRLKAGLRKSSTNLGDGIAGIFSRGRLDKEALEHLEDLLIAADLGPAIAADLSTSLAHTRFAQDITSKAVREVLAKQIANTLRPLSKPITLNPSYQPHVILFVGVNGTGKTTTIGKFAKQLIMEGNKMCIVAADTFRAAAIEQLQQWGDRAQCEVIAGDAGADPSGLVYDAVKRAHNNGFNGLLIDTAGRLHNVPNLMAELAKLVRVLGKIDAGAPHDVVLVLDATTGQNALLQVEAFHRTVGVTGLVVTKLDGSARGGVVVALAERFGLPIHAIGVGEGVNDLGAFDADEFACGLMNLGEEGIGLR